VPVSFGIPGSWSDDSTLVYTRKRSVNKIKGGPISAAIRRQLIARAIESRHVGLDSSLASSQRRRCCRSTVISVLRARTPRMPPRPRPPAGNDPLGSGGLLQRPGSAGDLWTPDILSDQLATFSGTGQAFAASTFARHCPHTSHLPALSLKIAGCPQFMHFGVDTGFSLHCSRGSSQSSGPQPARRRVRSRSKSEVRVHTDFRSGLRGRVRARAATRRFLGGVFLRCQIRGS
jgi:hypothetical protein